jgi:hypothetical protein
LDEAKDKEKAMHTYVLLAALGAFLVILFTWRIGQLKKLHNGHSIDPSPEVLGPKEVHRRRL